MRAILKPQGENVRAIIIEDKDAIALLDSLKLESLQLPKSSDYSNRPDADRMIQDIHYKFHYRVCKWLQQQGAEIVRGG